MSKTRIPLLMRILFAPLGWLLSLLGLLPFRVLFLLSDLLAFVARDLVRYRRPLVRANLRIAFPEMSAEEHRRVERKFYNHLTDYFVETLKFRSMSAASLRRHMVFENTQLIDETLASGRDIVIYTSHFGNWEWITSMGLWCRESEHARFSHVYRPLRQPWFNRWFLTLRTRYNVSIPMKQVLRQLLTWRRDGTRFITGFLSDQKPSHAGKVFTVPFMGVDTPFIGGTEELAAKLDATVMLFDTRVLGRGRYKSTIRLLTDSPRALMPGELTRLYAANLSEQIRSCPPAYLWSHNRWRLDKKNLVENNF